MLRRLGMVGTLAHALGLHLYCAQWLLVVVLLQLLLLREIRTLLLESPEGLSRHINGPTLPPLVFGQRLLEELLLLPQVNNALLIFLHLKDTLSYLLDASLDFFVEASRLGGISFESVLDCQGSPMAL